MDPLSITTSCLSLVSTVAKCSVAVNAFVQEVVDARGDLNRISVELDTLKDILPLLRDDLRHLSSTSLPTQLLTRLDSALNNCNDVVAEIESSLAAHETSRIGRRGYWTFGGGKDDMTKYRSSLEAHKSTIEIGYDMVRMSVLRDIKRDTRVLPEMKSEMAEMREILERIARLKARRIPGSNMILERFLDETTTYAETIIQGSVGSDTGLEDWLQSPRSSSPRRRSDIYSAYTPTDSKAADFGEMPRRVRNPRTRFYNQHTAVTSHTEPISDYSSGSSRVYDKSTDTRNATPPSKWGPSKNNGPSPQRMHKPVPSPSKIAGDTIRNSRYAVGPTLLRDFQNHLRRPDDWKWWTVHHATSAEFHTSSKSTEFSTHRYTAMTRGPSYASRSGFNLRQRDEQPYRQIMLLIGIYFPPTDQERKHDASARFVTTIESVTEALRTATHACGTTPAQIPWWTRVVVLLLHNETATSYEHGLAEPGMGLRCDARSEHCGMAPQHVDDVDKKIYAHLWEHTTSRTKFSWDRRGVPNVPAESDIPLQLIQCQYTARAGPMDLASEAHLAPFVQMLDARSCISVPAGEKISKFDILHSYDAARREKGDVTPCDSLRTYPKGFQPDAFDDRLAGVPARRYEWNNKVRFKDGRRPWGMRLGELFR